MAMAWFLCLLALATGLVARGQWEFKAHTCSLLFV